MEKLQQTIAKTLEQLKNLSQTQKLLIASLTVIVLMSMFLVVQYSSKPGMVELISDDPQSEILSTLRSAGFKVESKDGKVLIPPSERSAAIAQLSQSGALPSDSTLLFNTLMGKQDWRNSASKDRQQYIFALQNELARVISQFHDVRAAKVIIHAPETPGLGRASRAPTASVSIFSKSGAPIAQATVDAAARLVAGARSGLEVKNVNVVDGTSGRPRKPSDEGDLTSSNYLEHQQLVEKETREKIEDILAFIPGVIVAVTAQVDITQVSSRIQKNLPKNDGTISLPKRTETMTLSQSNPSNAAEPGMRSIAAMDVNQSASSKGTKVDQEETTEEFESAIGTEITNRIDPRGMPVSLVASVNIPEGFVEKLVRSEKGDSGADTPVTHDELVTRFESIKAEITASVQPHLRTHIEDGSTVEGEVTVTMVPIQFEMAPGAGEAGILSSIGGGLASGSGGLIDKVVLGALAAVAVGMMLMMVKRSGKKVELPTPSEIVGVPQSLAMDSDVIGEAGEGDSPLMGIEIEDDEVRVQNMLEQVAELVDQNPDGAARLLHRWIDSEE